MPKTAVVKQDPPCHICPAYCCHYYALEIDEPEDRDDFENIKWYIAHEGSSVYLEDGSWYLEVRARCTHLGADNRCQVYDRRPAICREYGVDEDGEVNCHMSDGELEYEAFFNTLEDVEAYVEKHFPLKPEKAKRAKKASSKKKSVKKTAKKPKLLPKLAKRRKAR